MSYPVNYILYVYLNFLIFFFPFFYPKKLNAATKCNGNREDQFPPGNLFVAVSEGLWDNGAACGRRYRLRCLSGNRRPCKGGTVDVKVVDFCPKSPCPSTILMSTDAFAAISRSSDDKINVEFIQYVNIYIFNLLNRLNHMSSIVTYTYSLSTIFNYEINFMIFFAGYDFDHPPT